MLPGPPQLPTCAVALEDLSQEFAAAQSAYSWADPAKNFLRLPALGLPCVGDLSCHGAVAVLPLPRDLKERVAQPSLQQARSSDVGVPGKHGDRKKSSEVALVKMLELSSVRNWLHALVARVVSTACEGHATQAVQSGNG